MKSYLFSLFPEKMCYVRIAVEKSLKKKLIDTLYDLKVIHIEETNDKEFLKEAKIEQNLETYSDMLLNLESVLKEIKGMDYEIIAIRKPFSTKPLLSEDKVLNYEKYIDDFEKQLKKLKELKDKYNNLNKIYILAERLRKLGVDNLSIIKENKSGLGFILLSLKDKDKFFENLKNLIKEGIISFTIYRDEEENRDYALIIHKGDEENIIKKLNEFIIKKHNIYDIVDYLLNYGNTTKDILDKVVKERAALVYELKELEEKVQKEYKSRQKELEDLLLSLKHIVNKYTQIDKFKESRSLFYVSGYIPCKDKNKLLKALSKISPNVFIEIKEVKKGEEVPVKIEHTRYVNPFKVFLDIYALPKYRYIDPTVLMFFTFPLFYGFILGDVGYGLVLGIFAYILKTKTPKGSIINNLAKVMLLSSASSIFFGLLFGEFFGFESIFGYEFHPILHRMGEIKELIGISILFGLIHINLGLLLGIYQQIRYKEYKHAVTEKFSWILLQISVGYLIYGYLENLPTYHRYVAYMLLILSIGLIYIGEGLKGIFELPSILSNVLSYARLGAVGLSSIAIAYVINVFVERFVESGSVGGYIAAIVLFLLGHTFNILLGIIGPFLHSLRLHYVEFFTKFYEGGGKEYSPYGILKKR